MTRKKRAGAPPLSLGMEGERWVPKLRALAVPVDGGTMLVQSFASSFAITCNNKYVRENDLLMVIAHLVAHGARQKGQEDENIQD